MPDDTRTLFDGRYDLEAVLGSGGSGTVHRAWDRVLDRPVALKLLRTSVPGEQALGARLRHEAQLAGALHHPGIAQVHDFGEAIRGDGSPDPTPYIVMQLVDGVPLDEVLRERGRLAPAEVMSIVARVAEALEAAHQRGIVHRDLKPGNILINAEGAPVLVDFGIARSADLEPLTCTGTIVGSVDYISPEQTAGRPATSRSDLYALGLVAYEALTGHRPFRRESQVATAVAHLHDDLPALPDEVPEPVARLVAQLAARDPADRPGSAAEVAARAGELVGELAGQSAVAGAPLAGTVTRGLDPLGSGGFRTVAAVAPGPGTETTSLPRPEEDPRSARLGRRTWIGAAVLAIAVAAGFLVSARPATVRVPDLYGQPYHDAVAALSAQNLDVVERRFVDDPSAARGTVLGQQPRPGSRIEEGAVVVLEVASGRERLDPASLTGLTYADAARAVVALGLVPIRAVTTSSESVGTVVSVQPSGHLTLGTPVTLTVAIAPTPPPASPDSSGDASSSSGGQTGSGEKGNKPDQPPGRSKKRSHPRRHGS